MAIKMIQKYQTSDGKFHDDKEIAILHENEVQSLAELGRILSVSVRTGRPESILRQILMEAPMVNAILRGYIKRLPKSEITPRIMLGGIREVAA